MNKPPSIAMIGDSLPSNERGNCIEITAEYLNRQIRSKYLDDSSGTEANPTDQRAASAPPESSCWAGYAQLLATKYHQGQYRRDGVTPYIHHPAAVAASFESDYCKSVAWLHDVLEDTEADLGELPAAFPDEIVDAVIAITKKNGEDYQQYLERVAANPLAKMVKIADIKHNLSDSPIVKQIEKYTKALRFLEPNTSISGVPDLSQSTGQPPNTAT